jgi:hypothetical protein
MDWFRQSNRDTIRYAMENEESPMEMAARMDRDEQRSEQELIPLPTLPPGAAHLAAAMRYQKRNIAEGKCCNCPKPLARNSVRYCEKHLLLLPVVTLGVSSSASLTPSMRRPVDVKARFFFLLSFRLFPFS